MTGVLLQLCKECLGKNYPQHSSAHDLSGAYQRHMLPIILAAAQAAKDECRQIQNITRKIVTSQVSSCKERPVPRHTLAKQK